MIRPLTGLPSCLRAKISNGTPNITEDLPNQSLAWKAVSGVPLAGQAGRVRFVPAPDTKGTTVISEIYYYQPAGAPGVSLAKLLGRIPEQFVRENLRRFKQLMEAGEDPHTLRAACGRGPISK